MFVYELSDCGFESRCSYLHWNCLVKEHKKKSSLLNCVPFMPYVLLWTRRPRANVSACESTFPRANESIFQIVVPTCQKSYQFFNLACQRPKRRAIFHVFLKDNLFQFLKFLKVLNIRKFQ